MKPISFLSVSKGRESRGGDEGHLLFVVFIKRGNWRGGRRRRLAAWTRHEIGCMAKGGEEEEDCLFTTLFAGFLLSDDYH